MDPLRGNISTDVSPQSGTKTRTFLFLEELAPLPCNSAETMDQFLHSLSEVSVLVSLAETDSSEVWQLVEFGSVMKWRFNVGGEGGSSPAWSPVEGAGQEVGGSAQPAWPILAWSHPAHCLIRILW